VLPLIGNFGLFILALLAGVAVMTVLFIALRSREANLAQVEATATV
jgi:PTS system fructose-specific IIC component